MKLGVDEGSAIRESATILNTQFGMSSIQKQHLNLLREQFPILTFIPNTQVYELVVYCR